MKYPKHKKCFYNIVVPSMEVSSLGFTCTSSDQLSEEDNCDNVLSSNDKVGWFTNGDGIGSWIKIYFNENIRVSKIIYRHNTRLPGKELNQNFKDVLIRFSDGTQLNTTLDDTFDVDLKYRVTPPKISTYLELYFISTYNLRNTPFNNAEKGDKEFDQNKFGLSKLAVAGNFEGGKFISPGKSNLDLQLYMHRIYLKVLYNLNNFRAI